MSISLIQPDENFRYVFKHKMYDEKYVFYNYADYAGGFSSHHGMFFIQRGTFFKSEKGRRGNNFQPIVFNSAVQTWVSFLDGKIEIEDKKFYPFIKKGNLYSSKDGETVRIICRKIIGRKKYIVENKPIHEIRIGKSYNIQFLIQLHELKNYKGGCLPIALAILTGIPVQTIAEKLIQGNYKINKKRGGSKIEGINVLRDLGYDYNDVSRKYIPNWMDTITLHIILPQYRSFLILVDKHGYAFKQGRSYNYRNDKFQKVLQIFEVFKRSSNE